MAATLSMEADDKKMAKYIEATEKMGIKIFPPHINDSDIEFTPTDKGILYGLGSIKGIGEAKTTPILEERPFVSHIDMLERMPKKIINKKVITSLVKAGVFDWVNENRHKLINEVFDFRKDKDERLNEETFGRGEIIQYEQELLGSSITLKPEWDKVKVNKTTIQEFTIESVSEKNDRSGRLMGFFKLKTEGIEVKGLMFASHYGKFRNKALNASPGESFSLKGKKDEQGTFLIESIESTREGITRRISEVIPKVPLGFI